MCFQKLFFGFPLFLALTLATSCKKDVTDLPDRQDTGISNSSHNGGGIGFRDGGIPDSMIVLGQRIANPYTVANMTAAWNEVYRQNLTTVPPTHLYVRFLPADLAELRVLYDIETDQDVIFFDYPLDYEIVREGTYYHDPSLSEEDPTWLYAVVRPDFQFPNVQYEILEELVLAPYFSWMTARAYERIGREYDWDDFFNYTGLDPVGDDPPTAECSEYCPFWPCCYNYINFPCYWDCWYPPGCEPMTPEWPECTGLPSGGGGTYTNNNACGCPIPGNKRWASGCIRVFDTQFAPANPGVRRVKVVVVDNLFEVNTTFTDDNGCFNIEHEHHGKAKVKVIFENNRCVVRAIRKLGKLWQYAAPLEHKFEEWGPSFNNINVLYVQSTAEGSNTRAHWYAATGNNALFEFDGFTATDGITQPPRLEILLTPFASGEAAPMFAKMSQNPLVFLGFANGALGLAAVLGMTPGLPNGPGLTVVISALSLYLVSNAPDIVYNHGAEGLRPSDQVKERYYHEYSHASHWEALNDNGYWFGNEIYIADNGGYGDGTATGAQRCAIIEMWGYHYGPVCADYQYGVSHSLGSGNPAFANDNRHIYSLESFIPNSIAIDPDNWMPKGLFWDCIDNNALNPPVNPSGGFAGEGAVPDPVMGFTHSNCFSAISNSSNQISTVRNTLTSSFLPPSQTVAGVNALFALYGF